VLGCALVAGGIWLAGRAVDSYQPWSDARLRWTCGELCADPRSTGRAAASNVGSVSLVDGSPAHNYGALAQLVARFHGMEEVRGSNPLSSTIVMSQDIGDTLNPLTRLWSWFADASGLVIDGWVED
jgi:hypothetical protein